MREDITELSKGRTDRWYKNPQKVLERYLSKLNMRNKGEEEKDTG
jgi:hypothetical protein